MSAPTADAVDLVADVEVWRAFIRRAEAFLDEGLFGLVSPQQAFRNAAIALTEVQP